MINPYKNRQKSALAIKTAEKLSRWVATITTGIGGGLWGYSIALKYLPEAWSGSQYLAAIVGLSFSIMLGWLTDHAFGDLLQRVVTDVVAAKHPNAIQWQGPEYFKKLRRIESIGFCIVLACLFGFDAYTTLIIRDPVADEAKKIAITDLAAATATVSAQQQQSTAPMLNQIRQLKSDIAAAERRAATSNTSLSKLAAEGNSWAKSVIAKNKAAATKAARAELEKTTSAYTYALSSQSEALAKTQQIINQQNIEADQANQRNRAVMAGMYTGMTVGPKILSIILRILMVITFFAYSSSLELDLNGDGVVDYGDVNEFYANLVNERQQKEAAAAAKKSAAPTRGHRPDFDDIPRTDFK